MKFNFGEFVKKKIDIDKIFKQNRKKKLKDKRNFIPLYPNYSSDNDIYVKRLQEALKDERILNIGVTGPYGSGKSSVLLELVNRLPDKSKCITVSLATFGSKNKKNRDNTTEKVQITNTSGEVQITDNTSEVKITDNNGDGKRDIKDLEIGILQQIIYKVDPKKIPLSKIVRIKEEREGLFRAIITAIIYLLNSSILNETNAYFWNLLKSIPKYGVYFSSSFISIILHIIMFILIYIALGVLLRKFNITSVSFKGVDLISESKSESILNKYIDEIIYILKKSKYNIIIFEDIDRFNEEEIFIKLRELNKIINDNDTIIKNGKVRFIYAVKDDILVNAEERTKFFDFIVPIIPIISNNNAQLKFIETLDKIGLKGIVSEDIIQEVSYFVNDMRLVINICNEFKVYYEKIYKKINTKDGNYSVDQLFAIMAYKNLEPEDFKNMQYDKGHINELIADKKYVYDLIKKDIQDLEDKNIKRNNETENKINQIKKEIVNRYDLRALTVNHGYFVGRQYYENSKLFIENANLEDIFEKGIKGDNEDRSKKVEEIYSKNTWRDEYNKLQRLSNREIERNNGQIKYLKRRMTLNESLKEILEKDNEIFNRIYDEIDFDDKEKKNLLERILKNTILMKFIRNGYITEEYQYYINNIYLENMTIEEYNFIASVKIGKKEINYTTRLPNIKIVNSRLNVNDFGNEYILNFDLLKYLLKQKKENVLKEKLYFMAHHIKKNIEKGGDFLFYFIDNVEDKKFFLNEIIEYAYDIWSTISKYTTLEAKEKYMEYFLKYSNKKGFDTLDAFSEFKADLEKLENIKISEVERVAKIYKDLKFKNISKFEKELLNFVVERKMYEINIDNINTILINYSAQQYNDYDNLYYDIFNGIMQISKYNVRNYIKENIDDFLENVLRFYNVTIEVYELNEIIACEPSIDKLEMILGKVLDNCIIDITDIYNNKYWSVLLGKNKIHIDMNNILIYHNQFGLSKELKSILKDDKSFNQIFKDVYILDVNDEFEELLINISYIDEISLSKISRLTDIYMKRKNKKLYLDLERVSKDKIRYFIHQNIVCFNAKNYKTVKNRFPDDLIEFCFNNIEDFIKDYDSLKVTKELKDSLLNSSLSEIYKIKLRKLFSNSDTNDMYTV